MLGPGFTGGSACYGCICSFTVSGAYVKMRHRESHTFYFGVEGDGHSSRKISQSISHDFLHS